MKQLGLGKNSLEKHIEIETLELNRYLASLIKSGQRKIRVDDFFDLPSLNVIWSLVNTSRFDYDDAHLKKMIELIDKFTMNNFVGPLGKYINHNIFLSLAHIDKCFLCFLVGIPYLKHMWPFSTIYNNIKNYMDVFKGYIKDLVVEQKVTFDEDNMR